MTETAAISCEDLTVILRGRTILENVTFELEAGGFMGLIGPNGGGKSVLLRTIAGLMPPASGKVSIFGKTPHEGRSLIGWVPQFARFEQDMPVRVLNVVLTGLLRKNGGFFGYGAEQKNTALKVIADVGLEGHEGAQVGKLSGGQMQRVLIARALVSNPKLLLLDEPTASLDTVVGKSFYELLSRLSEHMTIVLVSHDLSVMAREVRTIACLNRTLHYHNDKEIPESAITAAYGCPVELLAHGHAHRVLDCHGHEEADE
jgi:zinc transport system ATP-binding protein